MSMYEFMDKNIDDTTRPKIRRKQKQFENIQHLWWLLKTCYKNEIQLHTGYSEFVWRYSRQGQVNYNNDQIIIDDFRNTNMLSFHIYIIHGIG